MLLPGPLQESAQLVQTGVWGDQRSELLTSRSMWGQCPSGQCRRPWPYCFHIVTFKLFLEKQHSIPPVSTVNKHPVMLAGVLALLQRQQISFPLKAVSGAQFYNSINREHTRLSCQHVSGLLPHMMTECSRSRSHGDTGQVGQEKGDFKNGIEIRETFLRHKRCIYNHEYKKH